MKIYDQITEVLNNSIKGEEITLPKCSVDYARKCIVNYNQENKRYFVLMNLKTGVKIEEL